MELGKPGDYVATTIGETAVIVVRDAAGAINAFVNRCAHRGNLLCLERQGNVKEFDCIYHGWIYNLTGQLTGVAFEHGVQRQGGMPPEFRKEEHQLATAARPPNSAAWCSAPSAKPRPTWKPGSAPTSHAGCCA